MLISSLTVRQLLNNIQKQILTRSTSFVNCQVKLQENENDEDKGLFKHFEINEQTQQRLKSRGVEYLFPVQFRSFNDIVSGKDCIVQARKTSSPTYSIQ